MRRECCTSTCILAPAQGSVGVKHAQPYLSQHIMINNYECEITYAVALMFSMVEWVLTFCGTCSFTRMY